MQKFARICTLLICPLLALTSATQEDPWVLLALIVASLGALSGVFAVWRDAGLASDDTITLKIHT